MAHIRIPSLLREFVDGAESVSVDGQTVGECLNQLDNIYPGIRDRLCRENDLIPTMNVAIDGKIGRRRLKTRVESDSVIHFIPAIAGG